MDYYRKIGYVKHDKLKNDFDGIIDKFKNKAIKLGFSGELKIIKEKGNIVFFVKLNL